ncbi:MAG TPA: hypothetical protein VGM88_13985 [Kofleriaceae bacterium]|jgi:hypothetical protein
MRIALVFAVLAASAAAHAQAPGADPPASPPPPAYQPLPPPDAPVEDLFRAHKIRIGLGWQLTVLGHPNTDTLVYGGGSLVLGVRVTPHLELTGELGGGGGSDSDNDNGSSRGTSIGFGLLGVRYHINPASPACVFVDADLGLTEIGWRGIDDDGRGARITIAAGVGIERRWRQFSLFSEVRWMTIGQGTVVDYAAPGPGDDYPNNAPAQRTGAQLMVGLSAFL